MFNVTLPKTFNVKKYNNIDLKVTSNKTINDKTFIGHSTRKYLNNTKQKIGENLKRWEIFKRYTNNYEYVHTSVPGTKQSISTLKPVSRAFFKLLEILNFKNLKFSGDIKTFHLAEGPGGFIEAISYYRDNKNDIYYGMTLISHETDIPGWEKGKHFINDNPNVNILQGEDNTGNLYSVENYKGCVKSFKNSMDLITADGGFDFSIDFTTQETIAARLIFTEIMYAITMQKKGGTFILKIFDIFNKATLEFIYLLTGLYENVDICKPDTCRKANSEKYIVCHNFLLENSDNYINKFIESLELLNSKKDLIITSILDHDLNHRFKTIMEEININLAYKQIYNILTTIKFIENTDRRNEKTITHIKSTNVKLCIDWCIENNVPYNKTNNFNNYKNNIFKTNG